MINNIQNPETESDLHISTHINQAELPAIISPVLELAQTPSEKDMLLIALLTAAGSCMQNLYFRYGIAAKRYYPNLQCFIVGSAACGKGIANLALDFIKPINDESQILIPGDATFPAFYKQLAKQHGRGYIHESEGSVITDIWRSSTANYNTALRKAAEHEPISRSRCREVSIIKCPRVSMLLTGTFSQYRALVPSIENGYFSRLLTMIVDDCQPFSSRYIEPAETSDTVVNIAATRFYKLCEKLSQSEPQEFQLTSAQRERLGHHLETAYPTLIRILGNDFHSVVLRMAVQIERIAMILSALRGNFTECSDNDYATAELIGNKLLFHMAQAYQLIKGVEKPALPEVKPLDQKQILLSLLPDEFESKHLVSEAQSQGISRATVLRWNDEWMQQGLIQKIKYGMYKKIA